MVNCSNCGFDAAEAKYCPNCGSEMQIEESVKSCPNCGEDVGESKFCPSCGTKIENDSVNLFCPNCGEDVGDSAFCPKCGTKISDDNQNSKSINNNSVTEKNIMDDVIDIDDKLSSKLGGLFSKSRAMGKVLDKTASYRYKNLSKSKNKMDRKYFEKIEPVFLEVYDSIDDEFVKDILLFERSMMMSGGGVVGIAASQIYTPTKDMDYAEAKKFYQKRVNEIVIEINKEKQNGTFDEEEFYKRKVKESTFDNVSVIGIPKSFKAFKKNKN